MVSAIADFVVSMGTGGRISSKGTIREVLGIEPQLAAQFHHDEEALKLDEDEEKLSEEEKVQQGKLVITEEVPIGHISWRACAFSP